MFWNDLVEDELYVHDNWFSDSIKGEKLHTHTNIESQFLFSHIVKLP